ASNGVLSGTPTATGQFNFTITAADTASHVRSSTFTVFINAAISCGTITLSATTFPNGTVNVAYPATTITQTGGAGTTTFAVTSGALPSGMSLSSGGTVSGTPTHTGAFTFTVTATDANGCTGFRGYSLTIGGNTAPTISSLPNTVTA